MWAWHEQLQVDFRTSARTGAVTHERSYRQWPRTRRSDFNTEGYRIPTFNIARRKVDSNISLWGCGYMCVIYENPWKFSSLCSVSWGCSLNFAAVLIWSIRLRNFFIVLKQRRICYVYIFIMYVYLLKNKFDWDSCDMV